MVNGPSKVAIYVGKAPHNPQHAVQRSPRNVTRNHNRSNPIKRLTTIHDSVIAAFFQTHLERHRPPRSPFTFPNSPFSSWFLFLDLRLMDLIAPSISSCSKEHQKIYQQWFSYADSGLFRLFFQ